MAQNLSEEQWMDLFVVQMSQDLPLVLEQMGPQKKNCPEVDRSGSNESAGADDIAGVRIYSCEYEPLPEPSAPLANSGAVASASPSPSPSLKWKSKTTLEFWEDNDNPVFNPVLGPYYLITKKDGKYTGDDIGYTHGKGMKFEKEVSPREKLGLSARTRLFTRPAEREEIRFGKVGEGDYRTILGSGEGFYGYGSGNGLTYASKTYWRTNVDPNDHSKYPVNYVDATDVKLTYSKKSFEEFAKRMKYESEFWVTVTAGVEVRRTGKDQKNSGGFGSSTQDWWHSLLGIGRYEYIDSRGRPTESSVKTTQTIGANGLPETQVNEEVRKVPYQAAPDLLTLEKWSAQLGIAIEGETQLLGGRCTLSMEAGGLISTEGSRQILGPNSFLYTNTKLHSTLLKSKKSGAPKLEATAGSVFYYYPKQILPTDTNFGGEGNLELEYNVGARRAKNLFTPFVRYRLPTGRQDFSNINDTDGITTIGFRMKFNQGPNLKKRR